MLGLIVCERCKGRGRIYRRGQRAEPCPVCHSKGASPNRESMQLSAIDAVRHCFVKLERGDTSPVNLELAVRRALQAGLSLEQIHRRAGVPMARLRRIGGGQDSLL